MRFLDFDSLDILEIKTVTEATKYYFARSSTVPACHYQALRSYTHIWAQEMNFNIVLASHKCFCDDSTRWKSTERYLQQLEIMSIIHVKINDVTNIKSFSRGPPINIENRCWRSFKLYRQYMTFDKETSNLSKGRKVFQF